MVQDETLRPHNVSLIDIFARISNVNPGTVRLVELSSRSIAGRKL
jgi:hypothetical protein